MNAVRTPLSYRIALPLLMGLPLLCTPSTPRAYTPDFARYAVLESGPGDRLGASLLTATQPRCELDLAASSFAAGDQVLASWRISNPAPTRVNVEIKIWFKVPGQAPYSIASNLEAGRPVTLPASLDEITEMTELFKVDDTTTRGIYEINCRLIDPVTGTMFSEDLNNFQVR